LLCIGSCSSAMPRGNEGAAVPGTVLMRISFSLSG
jgi:hypothetical protein